MFLKGSSACQAHKTRQLSYTSVKIPSYRSHIFNFSNKIHSSWSQHVPICIYPIIRSWWLRISNHPRHFRFPLVLVYFKLWWYIATVSVSFSCLLIALENSATNVYQSTNVLLAVDNTTVSYLWWFLLRSANNIYCFVSDDIEAFCKQYLLLCVRWHRSCDICDHRKAHSTLAGHYGE